MQPSFFVCKKQDFITKAERMLHGAAVLLATRRRGRVQEKQGIRGCILFTVRFLVQQLCQK